jgi:hypothetical protein
MSQYTEAGIHRIQKHEWVARYIEARQLAFTTANIASGWRGAGLKPFQPSRVIREMVPTTLDTLPQRPSTPTEYSILDTIFVNSSPL